MTTISINKEALRAMIREAVIKKLNEGKGKPSDKSEKHDEEGKKHLKGNEDKKNFAKDMADAKKRLKEAQELVATLQEKVVHTPEGSKLGKAAMSMEKEEIAGGVPGPVGPMENIQRKKKS